MAIDFFASGPGIIQLPAGVSGILAIANGGTGVTNVAQTYVPTLFNITNVASSTPGGCIFTQLGSVVWIAGGMLIDPTALASTVLEFTLPVATNMTDQSQLSGTGVFQDSTVTQAAAIFGNPANDRGSIRFICTDTVQRFLNFTCMYLVI